MHFLAGATSKSEDNFLFPSKDWEIVAMDNVLKRRRFAKVFFFNKRNLLLLWECSFWAKLTEWSLIQTMSTILEHIMDDKIWWQSSPGVYTCQEDKPHSKSPLPPSQMRTASKQFSLPMSKSFTWPTVAVFFTGLQSGMNLVIFQSTLRLKKNYGWISFYSRETTDLIPESIWSPVLWAEVGGGAGGKLLVENVALGVISWKVKLSFPDWLVL